jgi:hypothetical protein
VTDKKTPEEDFKRFESFVEGMEDIEYEYWIANEATDKQKRLALELREELDEDEADELISMHRDALRRFYSRW